METPSVDTTGAEVKFVWNIATGIQHDGDLIFGFIKEAGLL